MGTRGEDKKIEGNFVESEAYEPRPTYTNGLSQLYGDVWEWTTSPYEFKCKKVFEYNGMVRGGLVSHPRAISGVLIEISFTLRTVGSSVGSD